MNTFVHIFFSFVVQSFISSLFNRTCHKVVCFSFGRLMTIIIMILYRFPRAKCNDLWFGKIACDDFSSHARGLVGPGASQGLSMYLRNMNESSEGVLSEPRKTMNSQFSSVCKLKVRGVSFSLGVYSLKRWRRKYLKDLSKFHCSFTSVCVCAPVCVFLANSSTKCLGNGVGSVSNARSFEWGIHWEQWCW